MKPPMQLLLRLSVFFVVIPQGSAVAAPLLLLLLLSFLLSSRRDLLLPLPVLKSVSSLQIRVKPSLAWHRHQRWN
jgi:hypothetical protein